MDKIFSFFKKSYNILFFAIFCSIAILGICYHIYYWKLFSANSFFCDECCIVLNAYTCNLGNIFKAQNYGQVTPIFFLFLSKLLVSKYQLNESILRILPLAGNLLSISLFPILIVQSLRNKLGRIYALVLFIINYHFLTYSVLFKHYSFDILLSILLLILAIRFKNFKISESKNKIIIPLILGILSCLCVLVSYTSVIVIAGIFFAFILQKSDISIFNKFRSKEFFSFSLPIIIFTLFFVVNIYIPVLKEGTMTGSWFTDGRMPSQLVFHLNNYDSSVWGKIVKYLFIGHNYINSKIIVILLLTSLYCFYKQDRFLFNFFFSEILLILLLSMCHIYPLGADRIILYLLPLFCILFAKSFDFIFFNNKIIAFITIPLFLFAVEYKSAYDDFINYLQYRPAIIEPGKTKFYFNLLQHSDIKKDDYVLIPFKLDLYAYNYFNQLHLSNPKEQIIEVSDLDNIKNNSIIYFYLSETNYNRIFYNQSKQWIDKNCNIVYKIHNNYHYDQNNKYRDTEPYAGDFIKCIRK